MIHGGTVLLVEDDPADVFLMKRSFGKANITQELLVAKNGVEAIDFLSQADPNSSLGNLRVLPSLVVLDLKLPLKSGLEVLRWMQEQPLIKRIPVIVFTSSMDQKDVSGAYDSGVSGYFLKRGSLNELYRLTSVWRDYWLIHNNPPNLVD